MHTLGHLEPSRTLSAARPPLASISNNQNPSSAAADSQPPSPFSLLYTNACSLHKKMTELRCRVCEPKPQVIIITETWRQEGIQDAPVDLDGNISSSDKTDNSDEGGGHHHVKFRIVTESCAPHPPSRRPTIVWIRSNNLRASFNAMLSSHSCGLQKPERHRRRSCLSIPSHGCGLKTTHRWCSPY